jgi:hypothetical protein
MQEYLQGATVGRQSHHQICSHPRMAIRDRPHVPHFTALDGSMRERVEAENA